MSATVTAKGQITIPKEIRDYLGLKPGSQVGFQRNKDGEIVVVAAGPRPASRFRAALGHAGKGLSTEEIMKLLRPAD
jgi:antitoxin PrlF